MKTMRTIGLSLLCLFTVEALRWSEELDSARGPINICSGQDIQLFWNFTLEKGERLKSMVWDCQPEGQKIEILATYVDDHFVPKSSFSGRLSHLKDAGLQLSCATILESGNYSIAVSTENAFNAMSVHHKAAAVVVNDVPKTMDGQLHVSQDHEATRDVTTGDWHVQLSCGNFSDRGHPPIDVIWTGPKGEELSSSSYEDGFFKLTVPNPVMEGNYTCRINSLQPASRCLEPDSPMLDSARVHVQATTVRFSLLEARQQEVLDKLIEGRDHWMSEVAILVNKTDGLQDKLDKLVNDTTKIHFHVRLVTNTIILTGNVIKFTKVISNEGQGYSSVTGHFTAPTSGSYFFTGTSGSYSGGSWSNMHLMWEGREVARTYVLMYGGYYSTGTCHVTLHLKEGEKVWLQSSDSSYFHWPVTSFTGFRI